MTSRVRVIALAVLAWSVLGLTGCGDGEIEGADEPGAVVIGRNLQVDLAGRQVAASGIGETSATLHVPDDTGIAVPTKVTEGDEVTVNGQRFVVRTIDDTATTTSTSLEGVVVPVPAEPGT